MEGGEAGLLVGLEGVVPGEGEGVDMGPVGGDWEAGLNKGESARIGQERAPALLERGRVREGGAGLNGRGAEVAHGAEVVVGRGRLALRVGGGDVEAERAVEVHGRCLLLVDRQHHVRCHRDTRWWPEEEQEIGVGAEGVIASR